MDLLLQRLTHREVVDLVDGVSSRTHACVRAHARTLTLTLVQDKNNLLHVAVEAGASDIVYVLDTRFPELVAMRNKVRASALLHALARTPSRTLPGRSPALRHGGRLCAVVRGPCRGGEGRRVPQPTERRQRGHRWAQRGSGG